MAEALKVEVRENRGTRESRRMRKNGQIPAVLYGHGEATVSLAIGHDDEATLVHDHQCIRDGIEQIGKNVVHVRACEHPPRTGSLRRVRI